jgi:hypothetical protein
VAEAYAACEPDVALSPGDPRYIDLTQVRGRVNVAQRVTRRILRVSPPQFHQQLITGHRGSGKSTELMRLQARLRQEKFFAIYLDLENILDLGDILYLDVLLAMARAVYEDLEGEKIKLSPELLKNLDRWFAERVLTEEQWRDAEAGLRGELGIGVELPFFIRCLATITGQIRAGGSRREEVRRKLEPQLREFLDSLNLLLDDAQVQLSRANWAGLAVIVDGLEKMHYRPLPDGQSSHSALFVQHAEQLKRPRCHLIYTVPVSLAFNANLGDSFGEIEIIPMVTVVGEDGKTPNQEGRQALFNLVAERVKVDQVFESEEAVWKLVDVCGGSVRDLVRLVRFACDEAEDRITMDHVQRAILQLVREYDYLVKDEDLDALVKIAVHRRVPGDEASARFLHLRLVLEYYNEPRYANLHPAVRLTPRVRERLKEKGLDSG